MKVVAYCWITLTDADRKGKTHQLPMLTSSHAVAERSRDALSVSNNSIVTN